MNKAKRKAVRDNMDLGVTIMGVICEITGPNEFSKFKANLLLKNAHYGPEGYDDYFQNTAALSETMPDWDKFIAGLEAVWNNEDADFRTIDKEDMPTVIEQILVDDEKDDEISPEVQKEIDDMMKEIDEELEAEEAAEAEEDNDLTDDDKEIVYVNGGTCVVGEELPTESVTESAVAYESE